ncbi:MAG: DUF2284 domain-containing protein [Thermodesulfobacteriota bacterium]
MVEETKIVHKTSTGNLYPLSLGWVTIPTNKIPYDKELTNRACLAGCNLYNRNGGCPPFSPDFRQILCNYNYRVATFIYAKLLTDDYPERVLRGNYYVKWSLVEALLTPLLNRFKIIADLKNDFLFLSSGFCKGCGNKKCAVKDRKKCRNPLQRTFSLESTGVIVTDVTKKFLGFELYWWNKQDINYIPPYMVKIVALIGNQPIDNSEIMSILEGGQTKGTPSLPSRG